MQFAKDAHCILPPYQIQRRFKLRRATPKRPITTALNRAVSLSDGLGPTVCLQAAMHTPTTKTVCAQYVLDREVFAAPRTRKGSDADVRNGKDECKRGKCSWRNDTNERSAVDEDADQKCSW